jgi:uncharacterized protein YraI
MESKYGFKKFTIAEFEAWIAQIKVARTIRTVQQHHTYLPNYSHFDGDNHFKVQRGMKNHHVNSNGWQDIGQHFTSFSDGTVVTGRSLETSPACIYGFNSNSVCIEHLGDFDQNKDEMSAEHQDTAIRMTAAICRKFSIAANTDKIVYHHWFNLSTGRRNDGTGKNKSCPGTHFFGGNKVEDANRNFIPKVAALLAGKVLAEPQTKLIKYVTVTANRLNIRKGPSTSFSKVSDRQPALLGSNLRVYEIKDGWYKISSSTEHWVFGQYAVDVFRTTVTASKLNARSGPGTNYGRVDSFPKNRELWIEEIDGGWAKVVFENTWVSKQYLKFE